MNLLPRKNRIIPAGYQVFALTLEGMSPLLMNSGEVDQDGDLYRAYETLAAKRGKTQEDKARLRELEWHCRIFFDDEIGPYVPSKNVKEMLRSAATAWKLGERVKRSLVFPEYRIPLQYQGPRTLEGLWAEGYRYTTMVANAGAGSGRVLRTRPCFDEWAIETEIAIDPTELEGDQLANIVERAKKYGLGDYRPEFGSFEARLVFDREQRSDANANGAKTTNARETKAHKAHVDRVLAGDKGGA